MSEATIPAVPPPAVPPPAVPPPGSKEATPDAWHSALQEAIKTRDAAKARAAALDTELTRYRETEAQRTAADSAAQAKAERERMEAEGKYREILAGETKKHEEALKSLKASFATKMLPRAIKAAAAEIPGIAKESLDDLPKLVSDRLAIGEDGEVYVVDEKTGKPKVNERLEPVAVKEFLEKFVTTRSYLMADGMPKSHGAPSSTTPVKGTFQEALDNPAFMREWREKDPEGLQKAQAEHFSPGNVRARFRKK